jgi:hypothetical protein
MKAEEEVLNFLMRGMIRLFEERKNAKAEPRVSFRLVTKAETKTEQEQKMALMMEALLEAMLEMLEAMLEEKAGVMVETAE